MASTSPQYLRRLSSYLLFPIVVGVLTCGLWWGIFRVSRLLLSILFFRGSLASIGCFLVLMVACLLLRRLRVFGPVITGASLGLVGLYIGLIMTLFVLFPVSYDRSVSIFLLSRIAASGSKGMSAEELERDLIERYVSEHGAVTRRIQEQLTSGTIKQGAADARVTISERGQRLLCLNPLLERLFDYHNPELTGVCPLK